MIDERMEHWRNNNFQGKAKVLEGKPAPMALCPPQITHGLFRDESRASVVRSRQLTAI
jgi:hypothetical protein